LSWKHCPAFLKIAKSVAFADVPGQVCNSLYWCGLPGGCHATFTNNDSQYAFGFCSLQYAQIISGGPVNRNVNTTLVGGASALCTRMGIAARSLHEAGQIDTACGASEMPEDELEHSDA
jgi:hypothetical protein